MTKLLLTRHGHVDGINPERFRGRVDLQLTALGNSQAQSLARRIAANWQPVAIYSSPMNRCVTTAREIAKSCGVAVAILDDLNDLDYGKWQWMTHDSVRSTWPEEYAAWRDTPHLVRFPGGDSLQDIVARTANALRFVLAHHPAEQTVVLVGHDSVNRALLLQLLDQPLSAYWRLAQEPCAINEIDVHKGKVQVRSVNDTCHL